MLAHRVDHGLHRFACGDEGIDRGLGVLRVDVVVLGPVDDQHPAGRVPGGASNLVELHGN